MYIDLVRMHSCKCSMVMFLASSDGTGRNHYLIDVNKATGYDYFPIYVLEKKPGLQLNPLFNDCFNMHLSTEV